MSSSGFGSFEGGQASFVQQSMQPSQQLPWSQQGQNRAQELEGSSAAPAAGQQSDDEEPLDELLSVSGAEVLNRVEACTLWFLSELQAGAIPDLQLVIAKAHTVDCPLLCCSAARRSATVLLRCCLLPQCI